MPAAPRAPPPTASELATAAATSRGRAASASMKNAAVLPVPTPIVDPASTYSIAASAAARFMSSRSMPSSSLREAERNPARPMAAPAAVTAAARHAVGLPPCPCTNPHPRTPRPPARRSSGPWRGSPTGASVLPPATTGRGAARADRPGHRRGGRHAPAPRRRLPDGGPAGPPSLPGVHPGDADGGGGDRRHGRLGRRWSSAAAASRRARRSTPKTRRFAGSPTPPASRPRRKAPSSAAARSPT